MSGNDALNVLIVITDQQRTDSVSCYGSPFTCTPNLDRLAREGVLCQRAYCSNPVCTPARASIFSGQYVSRHGAWNVGLNVPGDVRFISHWLSEAVYRTHYIGKAHFQAFDATPEQSLEAVRGWERHYPGFTGPYYGFQSVELALGHCTYGLAGHYGAWVRSQVSEEEFRSFSQSRRYGDFDFGGNAHDWHIPLRLHNSVWTADRAIEFLKTHDRKRPFLLAVGFEDPHHPHGVPVELLDRVDPEQVPPPRYAEGELRDKPPFFALARKGLLEGSPFRGAFWVAGQAEGADFSRVSEQDARLGRAYYYTLVRLIDREFGRILDCLDSLGLADNTLVVFTTDHGELLGDHGLWMKGPFHYEELVRVPMLFRWPGGLPAGQQVTGLISQVDLVPTILSAMGRAVPEEVEGVNALPLLRGEASRVREGAVIECVDDPCGLRLKTVVTERYKLTLYHRHSFGELYDLQADPGELHNLFDRPESASVRQRLTGMILDHAERLERRTCRLCYA